MDEQRQDDQLETTCSNSVSIRNVDLRTCRKQWTIEKDGESGSEISMLMARHHDDDYVDINTQVSVFPKKLCFFYWAIMATSL